MNDTATSQYLLPSGLRDLLPPEARHQTWILGTLLSCFDNCGYAQVMPPLAEYEQTLLAGKGEALQTRTFRMMDPLSGQMLAVRSDMTTQISRIAESRLNHEPLPLRLSYAGNVLRAQADGLGSERQLTQAGLELIGCDAQAAEAEIIGVLLEALEALECTGLVVDLSAAGLLEAILAEETVPYDREEIVTALRHKDASALPKDLACREVLAALLEAAGSPDSIREVMNRLYIPSPARLLIEQLFVVTMLLPVREGVSVTMDPLEFSGFDYHQGVCFSLFHAGSRSEIGRGGRYSLKVNGVAVSATGATLYVGRLLSSYKAPPAPIRAYIPYGIPQQHTRHLREEGVVTVFSLAPGAEDAAEAKRLGCTHIYTEGTLKPLA